jgi:hypothetical protein
MPDEIPLEYWFDMACTEETLAARREEWVRKVENPVARAVLRIEARKYRDAADDSFNIAMGYALC